MKDTTNPYAAPASTPGTNSEPPGLTPLQRAALANYLEWHDRPPTVGGVLRTHWKHYTKVVGFMLAALIATIWLGWAPLAWFLGGMFYGMCANSMGQIRALIRVWPMLDALFDWDRARRLQADPDAPLPVGPELHREVPTG